MTQDKSAVKANVDAAVADVVVSNLSGKKWYLSKTFWVNVLAAGGIALQAKTGFVIGPEYQALLLSLVNLGLRKITKDPVVW